MVVAAKRRVIQASVGQVERQVIVGIREQGAREQAAFPASAAQVAARERQGSLDFLGSPAIADSQGQADTQALPE